VSATPAHPGDGRIAVLASRVGVDEKQLFDALDRRGVPFDHVDTREQWFLTGQRDLAWSLVLNREIGQVRAAYAARCLASAGVEVVNNVDATEVCGDKWRTTMALQAAGVATPRTAFGLTPKAALAALDSIGYPAVIKPLLGSWGRLVVRLSDRACAEGVFEYVAALPGWALSTGAVSCGVPTWRSERGPGRVRRHRRLPSCRSTLPPLSAPT
jgi:[lysine-biosynthesis-protein LysW]---L-2-aminoadipate ligase